MNEKDEAAITIGKNIRRFMDAKQLSRQDLADLLGVSVTSVGFWCAGSRIPRMEKIDKMCSIFKCTRSDIVGSPSGHERLAQSTASFWMDAELLNALSIYYQLPPEKKQHVLDTIYLLGRDMQQNGIDDTRVSQGDAQKRVKKP